MDYILFLGNNVKQCLDEAEYCVKNCFRQNIYKFVICNFRKLRNVFLLGIQQNVVDLLQVCFLIVEAVIHLSFLKSPINCLKLCSVKKLNLIPLCLLLFDTMECQLNCNVFVQQRPEQV